VLVVLVLLLGEGIGVGGDADCCWSMQWCSSCWCFSSGRASALVAMMTAAVAHAVVLVVLVLLLGESIGVGCDGDCCWSMQ
jgi:hypothetical protein